MAHPFTKLFALVLLPMAVVTFQIGASGASLAVAPGASSVTPVDVGAAAAPVAPDARQPVVVVEEVVIAPAVAPAKRRARPASPRVTHATAETTIQVAPEANANPPVAAPPAVVPVAALVDRAVRPQQPKFFAFAEEHPTSERTERSAAATTAKPSSTDVLADVEGLVRRGLAVDLTRQRPEDGPTTSVAAKANLFPVTFNLVGRFP